MKKDQVRARVLQAVIAAEVAKGHLKWKVSEIARFTKVSRPLIYYHFGKTKKDILTECLNVIAEDYYGLSSERAESLKSETILESLARTRKMFEKNPSLVVFYQRMRMQDSEANRMLVEIEKRYQQKLKKSFPQMSADQIQGLHALFHGMISAPFLTAGGLEAALKLVKLCLFIFLFLGSIARAGESVSMCSSFSPHNKIEVKCAGSFKESEVIRCPEPKKN